MAFPYDPNETNQALQTLGSSYQVPTQQPAPQAAAPAPAAQPAPETPDIQKPQSGGGMQDTMGQAQAVTGGLSGMTDDPEKKNGLDKLGGLIGMVLGAYTGNAQGMANGAKSMKGQ